MSCKSTAAPTAASANHTLSPVMPVVRGRTRVLLVLADPVHQVKAPEAFNHVFARAGVDAVVVPLQVGAAQLAGTVAALMASPSVGGLFVSIPYKTALPGLLARLSADATVAGAVNAVRRAADGAMEGDLFDGEGFVGALRHLGVPLHGARALLVGAGGAGLAIASALGRSTLGALVVRDADASRARALVQRLGAASRPALQAAASVDVAGFDLVINATPLGLKPGDVLPLDPQRLDAHAQVIDILMTARPTPLLQACHARGITAHPGHEMLIQQAPLYLDYFGFPDLAQRLRAPGSPWLHELRSLMLAGHTAA